MANVAHARYQILEPQSFLQPELLQLSFLEIPFVPYFICLNIRQSMKFPHYSTF